jgi:O-antigen ligase
MQPPFLQSRKYSRKVNMQKNLIRIQSLIPLVVTLIIAPNYFYKGATFPKYIAIVFSSIYCLLILLIEFEQARNNIFKKGLIPIFLIIFGTILSTFSSESPIVQSIFGTDRRLGFLTIISLSILYISFLVNNNKLLHLSTLKYFNIAAILVLVYGLMQLVNIDPFNWITGPSNLVSTLGNANFASAFVATSFVPVLILINQTKFGKMVKNFVSLIYIILIAFFLYFNSSLQGILILFAQIIIYLGILIHKNKNKIYFYTYGFIVSILSLLTLMGTFNLGPLKTILYSASVISRGDFWRAATLMIRNNFFTGVGPDAFGDNYGLYRDLKSSNRNFYERADSAHNYFLDFASMFGIFALIGLGIMIVMVLVRILKSLNRLGDNLTIATYLIWFSILLQALVSPISIPLILYLFIFSALILTSNDNDLYNKMENNYLMKNKLKPSLATLAFLGFASFFLTLLILGTSIQKDHILFIARNTGNLSLLEKSLSIKPLSTADFRTATQDLSNSNFLDYQLEIAYRAVEFNRKDVNNWAVIFLHPNSTPLERTKALKEYLKYDPTNREANELLNQISS